VDFGTHNADVAAVLRTLDYRREHHPEEEARIHKTTVTVEVADEAALREMVEQKAVPGNGAAVKSE
jgi:hypothetical protein